MFYLKHSLKNVKIILKRLLYFISTVLVPNVIIGEVIQYLSNLTEGLYAVLHDYLSQYIYLGPWWLASSLVLCLAVFLSYSDRKWLDMRKAMAFVRQKTKWFDFLPWHQHSVTPEGYTYQQILDWIKEKSLTAYGYPCVKGQAKWYTLARKIAYEEMPKTPDSHHIWSEDYQSILSEEKIPLYLYVKVKRKELNGQVRRARQIKKMAAREKMRLDS